MKLILNTKVELIEVYMLAEITIDAERKDLKKLVEVFKKNPKQVKDNDRLVHLLKTEKLVENDQLTEIASHLEKTGDFKSTEIGIYRIWYIKENQFFKREPIVIKRENLENTENPENKQDKKQFNFEAINHDISIFEDQEINTKKIYQITPKFLINVSHSNLKFDVKYEIDLSKKETIDLIKYTISGLIEGKNVSRTGEMKKAIHHNVFNTLKYDLQEDEGQFSILFSDSEVNSLQIDSEQDLNVIKNYELSKTFQNQAVSEYGTFEKICLEKIDVKPKDEFAAKIWHAQWIKHIYKKENRYLKVENLFQMQNRFLSHEKMKKYDLIKYNPKNLMVFFDPNCVEYWHNASIYDLLSDQILEQASKQPQKTNSKS